MLATRIIGACSLRLARLALLGLAFLAPLAISAELYPNRTIRLIVPAGAGGITDILARAVAAKMTEGMAQPIVVENKPGASAIIGTEFVAKSPPNGYTLLMFFPPHPVNPSLYAKLPYDTVKDFAPITMLGSVKLSLIVNSSLPAKDLNELIRMAKDSPGKLNYGIVDKGSLGHLGAELFLSMTGTRMAQIPYKGAPQAAAAVLSGDIALFFSTPNTAVPLIKAGKIRALGVSSKMRLDILPGVPAISEVLPGYEVLGWNGIVAPAGTPSQVIDLLQSEIVKSLKLPDMVTLFDKNGVDTVGNTPQQFAAIIKADIEKWARVLKDAGIKPE